MHFDGDIVDDGCNREVHGDGVTGVEAIGGEVGEGDESYTTRSTM